MTIFLLWLGTEPILQSARNPEIQIDPTDDGYLCDNLEHGQLWLVLLKKLDTVHVVVFLFIAAHLAPLPSIISSHLFRLNLLAVSRYAPLNKERQDHLLFYWHAAVLQGWTTATATEIDFFHAMRYKGGDWVLFAQVLLTQVQKLIEKINKYVRSGVATAKIETVGVIYF